MHLAACGNDCGACPRFTAKTEEELLAVAQAWHQAGWRDRVVSAGEIACAGCSAACPCRYGIIGCVTERNLSNCAECEDYPCENILNAFERAETHWQNCFETCDPDWFAVLEKAFFEKKKNLDALHAVRRKNIEE